MAIKKTVVKSKDTSPMTPAEKAKAKKILDKIVADSKKKAKAEVDKKKAPKTNWITKL
jgi:hypothetical protein